MEPNKSVVLMINQVDQIKQSYDIIGNQSEHQFIFANSYTFFINAQMVKLLQLNKSWDKKSDSNLLRSAKLYLYTIESSILVILFSAGE